MVLTYPKRNTFYVDFGTTRIEYRYYVMLKTRDNIAEQREWCSNNFKVDSWWCRYQIAEFAFVRERDAAWFALRWL